MAVSENLKTAVDTKNLDDVRGSLWSCIIVDLNMTGKFKESFDYVLSHGISESELFVEDDGKEFETEPTRENFNNLSGLFSVNFSKKKYEALKKIGETLNPPKINSASRETSPLLGRHCQSEQKTLNRQCDEQDSGLCGRSGSRGSRRSGIRQSHFRFSSSDFRRSRSRSSRRIYCRGRTFLKGLKAVQKEKH